MNYLGLIISFGSTITGFVILLALGINVKYISKSALHKTIFGTYLFYFLYQCLNLTNVLVHQISYPLGEEKQIAIFILGFVFVGGFTTLLFQFIAEIIQRKTRSLKLWGNLFIPLYFLLLLVIAFLTENNNTILTRLAFFLWVPGGLLTQLLTHGAIILGFAKRKSINSPFIFRYMKIFFILYLISLPFQFIEGVIYNFTNWRLFTESFQFNALFFLIWNIILIVLLTKKTITERYNRSPLLMHTVQLARKFRLTRREEEIIELLEKRRGIAEISDHLFISPRTAEKHISNIYKKTGVNSMAEIQKIINHGK